ncbi:MAG: hypothetical protein A3B68_00145 [Candidatus Melainabacteria bacterium RIFCSPHIGHO2_02_FULL_34_12]|nr:MAG: hypothetical protein A3B68_00145 [Candidatus Melainabacteria bacterium RIFCSPHIGHO2_02_FULL_34_12]
MSEPPEYKMSECQTINCPTCGLKVPETFVEQKCPRCQTLIDSKFVCGSCHNCTDTMLENEKPEGAVSKPRLLFQKIIGLFR